MPGDVTPLIFLGAIVILNAIGTRGLFQVTLVLVALGWMTMLRLMRSSVIERRSADYVDAARALGASTPRVIMRHILPNAIAPVIVYGTIFIGVAISVEASLSFLGVGLQLPAISWGLMINSSFTRILEVPHLLVFPGLFLSVLVLAFIVFPAIFAEVIAADAPLLAVGPSGVSVLPAVVVPDAPQATLVVRMPDGSPLPPAVSATIELGMLRAWPLGPERHDRVTFGFNLDATDFSARVSAPGFAPGRLLLGMRGLPPTGPARGGDLLARPAAIAFVVLVAEPGSSIPAAEAAFDVVALHQYAAGRLKTD